MNFCVIANPEKYSVQNSLSRVVDWCLHHKKNLFASRRLEQYIKPHWIGSYLTILEEETEAIQKSDVIIAIGGDGTMLHTAHLVKERGNPILGINTGKLGFMANIQQERIEEALGLISNNEFSIDKRFMLKAKTSEGRSYYALNEFLFSKKDSSSMITLEVHYDGQLINHYWADGLIVSSPTGSTAYNLSAGGPIVQPHTSVMVVTPINPHTLTTRPLVLTSDKILTVKGSETTEKILFSYDGIILPHNSELDVEIIQSEFSVNLIQLPDQNYFETLRNKLMWGLDKRKI